MKSTCPTQTQHERTQCGLYSTGSHWASHLIHGGLRWVLGGLRWVHLGLHWVREAFQIPTCWYQQHKSLALGYYPTRSPNKRGIAFWWNKGFISYHLLYPLHGMHYVKNHLKPNDGFLYWQKCIPIQPSIDYYDMSNLLFLLLKIMHAIWKKTHVDVLISLKKMLLPILKKLI